MPVIMLVIMFHFTPCSVCKEVSLCMKALGATDKYKTFTIKFGNLCLINCDGSACKYHANSIP